MSTWKGNLLAAPTRLWVALSFVLGLGIGLVAGIGWAVSGLVFGLLVWGPSHSLPDRSLILGLL